MLKKIVMIAIVLVIAGGAGYAYYWQSQQPVAYAGLTLAPQTVEYRFREEASVRAVKRGVVTSDVSGPILSVGPRLGDRVKAGDVIARVDVTELSAQVRQLEVQKKNIEAQWASQIETTRQQIAQLEAQKASGRAIDTTADILSQIALLERELSDDPSQSTGMSQYYRALLEQCDTQIRLLTEQLIRGGVFQEGPNDTRTMITDPPTLRAQLDAKYAERRSLEAQWVGHRDQTQTQIAQLRAQLSQNEKTGELSKDARHQVDNQISLLKKTMSTDEQSVTANLYRTMIEQTDVQIEEISRQLSGAVLSAPMSGVITRLSAETGGYIQKGALVLEIVDPANLEVECHVSTDDAAALKVGMEAALIWEKREGDKTFVGVVTDISPVAVQSVSALGLAEQRVRVKIKPTFPAEGAPGEGYGLSCEFVTHRVDGAIAIPKTALAKFDDRDAAWLIRDGALVCAPIQTGLETDRLIVVTSGLAAGDVVVLDASDETLAAGKLAMPK